VYDSPDLDTRLRELIRRIEGRTFAVNGVVAPVGTFTFRRIDWGSRGGRSNAPA